MADRQQPQAVQVIPQHRYDQGGYRGGATGGYGGGHQLGKGQGGPSASKILAVVTLLPVGGGLLALAGITLVGTLIGLAIATPLFIIFSPVIVPAVVVVGLAVTAFLTSGAFGLTGLTSLSWVLNWVREATRTMPETVDQAKKRMQDAVGYVGQKTKEVGQDIQKKAQYEGKHEGK